MITKPSPGAHPPRDTAKAGQAGGSGIGGGDALPMLFSPAGQEMPRAPTPLPQSDQTVETFEDVDGKRNPIPVHIFK